MNVVSRLITTSAKAALLSSTLLVILISIKDGEFYVVYFILFMISLIVTFIIAFIMLLATVFPFYELSNSKEVRNIFNLYFPYYMLVFFAGSLLIIYNADFRLDIVSFMIIPFTTAMQSWVWFFKTKQNESKEVS